jgi:hypothetical protein
MRIVKLVAVSTVAALLAGAAVASARPGSPSTGAIAAACKGMQLTGSFSVVRGSAGAGNISYALLLKNRSSRTCTLTGLPSVRLVGKSGKPLPTAVKAEHPGFLTAVLVTLRPNAWARATARFSPDVPGTGEPTQGARCESVAYRLRVNATGGGTTSVPVKPPTSVCEHGRLLFSAYTPRS